MIDLFPLYNSIRIAIISTVIIFFLGIFFAYYIYYLPSGIKGVLDVVLTLPLVLPPTVIGFFLIKILGPKSLLGGMAIRYFDLSLVMKWYSAIFASVIVALPLMYRTARAAFESFDSNLLYAAKTLGISNKKIFWRIIIPECKHGLIAGAVLAFARALGEYGATSMVAGFTQNETATISTTVYQLWRIGDDRGAYFWVLINILISTIVLLGINFAEGKKKC